MPVKAKRAQNLELHSFICDPHRVLGLHETCSGAKVIRLWRPGAPYVYLELFGERVEAKKTSSEGLFEREVPVKTTFADYRVFFHNGMLHSDPYAFLPTFEELDAYLFGRGVHYQLYEVMGARLCQHQGVQGVKFAVWAPSAEAVALVGDFNFWDGRFNPMRQVGASGVWELFIPGLESKEKYKFEVRTKEGHLRLKSDPYALFSEYRPATASVTFDVNNYIWGDQNWMHERALRSKDSFPMNVYEVHLGSWKKHGERMLSYRELAVELANYCKEMGFSHVELLPISEHPLDESWGYQVTGFFAATSRFGNPEDFQFFVDHLHQEGVGVILDWVPAHFPTDDYSLAQFDGTYLYEHEDPRKGFHPHWNTYIFNYGRFEVSNFLIASALFWLDKMHIDALRVDAVASMLYLDYGRKEGEWLPNKYGGNENLEAIEFIKHLNSVVHERFPHVSMIAEESTSYTGVSHPLEWGGLGFNMKWNMGWMNDTLRYFHKDPLFRSFHQNDLTFGLLYAFSERFVLPLSHDEVVHGKGALIAKMPGDDWQKFANLRLLYSYQICQPGKKLLFMGAEIGQWDEWNCKEQLSWDLLRYDRHAKLQCFFKEINHFYHENPSLWEFDFDHRGFEWVDLSDKHNSVLSYLRKGRDRYLFVIHNFSPNFVPQYFIQLSNVASIEEVFNTDREEYWGSGKINTTVEIICDPNGKQTGVQLELAPLSTMCFEVQFVF
jgi:1,4-alpha-glucan branching enzyme